MPLFDLNSDETKRRLAETVFWCTHEFTLPDDNQLRQYLEGWQKAVALMRVAHARSQRGWNRILRRDCTRLKEYRFAQTMLHEADPRCSLSFTEQLRSRALRPSQSLGEVCSDEERQLSVRSVIDRRAELIQAQKLDDIRLAGLAGGRLLLYSPEENVADGASQDASREFFDVYDAPPWDTWVGYSNRTLLSWVPAQLVDLVQAGIDANPVESIRWLA
jgi:hypothetical protein